jgi:hypothetical protein
MRARTTQRYNSALLSAIGKRTIGFLGVPHDAQEVTLVV